MFSGSAILYLRTPPYLYNPWYSIRRYNQINIFVKNTYDFLVFKTCVSSYRLRHLLLSEEQQYLEEMAASEETVLERQAKMRDRARQLKEKRELERQQLVETKLAQQWR